MRRILSAVALLAGLAPAWGEAQQSIPLIDHRAPALPSRTWTDDSGYHRVEARLYAWGPEHAVLHKDNRRYAIVPFHRLSPADQQYVASIRASLARPEPNASGLSLAPSPRAMGHTPQPVAYVVVSRELLHQFSRPLETEWPVSLCILGVPVRGTAETLAHVDVKLIPNQTRAVLELPVQGHVTSWTTGYAPPVEVYTRGTMAFTRRVQLVINGDGAQVRYGALQSESSFVTTGISTSARWLRRLILSIAGRRVQARKPLADQIAAAYQRSRLNHGLETNAEDLVARLDRRIGEIVARLEQTTALAGLELDFATSSSHLQLVISVPRAERLPSPPALDRTVTPFALHVHQGLLSALEGEARDELVSIFDNLLPNAQDRLRTVFGNSEIEVTAADQEWVTFSVVPQPRGHAATRDVQAAN